MSEGLKNGVVARRIPGLVVDQLADRVRSTRKKATDGSIGPNQHGTRCSVGTIAFCDSAFFLNEQIR